MDPSPLVELLLTEPGDYLRNSIRRPAVTCMTCCTPVSPGGWSQCHACSAHTREYSRGLADAAGFLIYGISGAQSGSIMYRYKDTPPVKGPLRTVSLLAITGLVIHCVCVERLLDAEVTHWTTVPSTKGRTGQHPLRQIISPWMPADEVAVGCPLPNPPRSVDPTMFTVPVMRAGSHLLVVDDTWASGARAQSLAVAAHRAGASAVSVLAVARWFNPSFDQNHTFMADHFRGKPYDPMQCPWTGGSCP